MLCLFLLDMGLVSARRLGGIRADSAFSHRLCHARAASCTRRSPSRIAHLLGLGRGDALLFTVLCASASYIAVPAAMRLAVPEANPGLYVTMSLALTFPFNIIIGLPLYLGVINRLWS